MIGIIGGTGNTGSCVVASLKSKNADFVCLARDPLAAKEKLGEDVSIVKADINDPASIEIGLSGCTKLFLLSGHNPTMAQQEISVIETAERVGVNHIVKLSGGDAIVQENTPAMIGRAHWEIEQALKSSNVDWTILRPAFFMQNLLNTAPIVIGQAKIMMPIIADVKIAMIDVRDTGDVAASVLTEDGHSKRTYFLGGYDYTLNDFSNKISDELGKKIPFVEIPIENAVAVMKDKGMPDWLIDHQVTLMGLVSSGVAAGANTNIENISGHRARSLADFVKDNINIFKS